MNHSVISTESSMEKSWIVREVRFLSRLKKTPAQSGEAVPLEGMTKIFAKLNTFWNLDLFNNPVLQGGEQ